MTISFIALHAHSASLTTLPLPTFSPRRGLYSQMSTAFQNQGCQMNLELAGTEIPVSALNCFDTLAILMLVPVFDQVLYPYCKKIGYPLTMLQKIGKQVCFGSKGVLATIQQCFAYMHYSSDLVFH
jgi:dipeptide/tripeptide permease